MASPALQPGRYQLRSDFTPESSEGNFLAASQGDVVTLKTCFDNGWSHVENQAGAAGFVPTGFLAPVQTPAAAAPPKPALLPKPVIHEQQQQQQPAPAKPPLPTGLAPKPVLPAPIQEPVPDSAAAADEPKLARTGSWIASQRQRSENRPASMFVGAATPRGPPGLPHLPPPIQRSGAAPPPLPASLPPVPPPLSPSSGAPPSPVRPGLPPALLNSIARRTPGSLDKRNSSLDAIPLIPLPQAVARADSGDADGDYPLTPSEDPHASLPELIELTKTRFNKQSELFDKIANALQQMSEHSRALTDDFRLLELLTREFSNLDFNRQERKRQMPGYFRALSETMLHLSHLHAQFDAALAQQVAPVVKQAQHAIPEARSAHAAAAELTHKRTVAENKLSQENQKSQIKLEKLAELERDFKTARAQEERQRRAAALSAWKSYETTNVCAVKALSSTVDALLSTASGVHASLAQSADRMRQQSYPPIFRETPPAQLERLFSAQPVEASSLDASPPSSSSSSPLAPSQTPLTTSSSSSVALTGSASSVARCRGPIDVLSAQDGASKLLRSLMADERSFLSELGLINDVFRSAVDDKLGRGELAEGDRAAIFGSVGAVIQMHSRLLEEIQEVVVNWPSRHIGTVFLDKTSDVDSAYVPFLGGYQRAVDTIAKCSKQSKLFAGLLRDEARRNGVRSLEDLLRLPLSRLSYYTGWIKQMLSALDVYQSEAAGHLDPAVLALVAEQIELLIEADDLFGSKVVDVERREMMADNLARVMQISQQVVGCGNLMLPDRRYIADEDCLHALTAAASDVTADHAFLFSDILLLAKREGAKFRFVQEIPLHRVQLPSVRDPGSFALVDTGPPEVSHDFAMPGKPVTVQAWANPDSGLLSRQIKEVEHATKVFGVSLATIMRREKGRIVPTFIEKTCNYILEKAVREEGIFRLSGMATQIAALKDQFNLGKKIFFSEDTDPNSVSGLIKLWFRELPEPLLTWGLYADFAAVIEMESAEEKTAQLAQAIAKLPQANKYVLQYLMKVCHIVAQNSEANKMTAQNLGVVFGPNLLKSRDNNDPANNYLVVQAMIQNYEALFGQIENEASVVVAKLEQEEREQTERRKQRQREREARLASVKSELLSAASSSAAALPAVSTSAVVREGWLQINTKTGSSLITGKNKKVWKTYWAVLRYKSFCYFKNKKDTKPKDRLVLKNAVIGSSTARENCFCLTVGGVTVFLVAVSQEDMDQWIEAFKSCAETSL